MAALVNKLLVAGVDIGGTGAKGVVCKLTNGELQLLEDSFIEIPSEVARGPRHVTELVVPEVLKQSAKTVDITPAQIQVVGVCFPAPVSFDGKILSISNLKNPDWVGFDVKNNLVRTIGRRDSLTPTFIVVANDAEATIPALLQQGEKGQVAGYFVGTGVGGATTIDGINLFKNEGGGSEPGATTFCFDEDQILFGHRGLVQNLRMEDYVSLVGVERLLEKMHRAGGIPRGHPILELEGTEHKTAWRVRAEKLLDYACQALADRNHSDFSLRIMDVSRKVLGSYLHIIIQSNRLSKIFIGGGIVDSRRVNPEFRKWYLDGVQEAARDSITQEIRRSEGFPEILAAELGDKTAAFGASKTAYNTWLADKSVLLATEKPSRSA